MGIFSVTVRVGHPEGGDLVPVTAMVDTGSTHTVLPNSLLESLSIQRRATRNIRIADGSRVQFGYGTALIAINDEQWPCPVIFGPENQFLLGATTLETFDLTVDPMDGELVPREHWARPI